MFKGNGTNCARIVPNSAFKFFSYEQASKKYLRGSSIISLFPCKQGILHLYRQRSGKWNGVEWENDVLVCCDLFPAEEAELTLLHLGAGACAGIIAMSATCPMDMVRGRLTFQIPYGGLNFAVCESLKDSLIKTKQFSLLKDSELSVSTRLACGAAAGTVGQTVAYPLGVVRRRMQIVGWKDPASVVTGEGKRKVVPAIAISFVTYVVVKDIVGVEMKIPE